MSKLRLTFMFQLLCFAFIFGDISWDSLPSKYQLFPRDSADSAHVPIVFHAPSAEANNIVVRLFKGASIFWQDSIAAPVAAETLFYSAHPGIAAGLFEYTLTVTADGALIKKIDSIVCGDVFIINGQSNSCAMGNYTTVFSLSTTRKWTKEWIRTLGSWPSDSQDWVDAYSLNRATVVNFGLRDTLWAPARVWGSDQQYQIGGIGYGLALSLVESNNIPVCVFNGGVLGSPIHKHLRNAITPSDPTSIYGRLLYRIKKAGVQDRIKGIVWYQGEGDSYYMDTYDNNSEQIIRMSYAEKFDSLYRSWKADFPGFRKVYICQLKYGTWPGPMVCTIKEFQRTAQTRYPDIETINAAGVSGDKADLHFSLEGYAGLAERLARLIKRDFYSNADTSHISSPDIVSATLDDSRTLLELVFSDTVFWPNDTLVFGRSVSLKDYFYFDTPVFSPYYVTFNRKKINYFDSTYRRSFDSIRVTGEKVYFRFSVPQNITRVSGGAVSTYNESDSMFNGPWLRNSRGIPALYFHNFPISTGANTLTSTLPDAQDGRMRVFPCPFRHSFNVDLPLLSGKTGGRLISLNLLDVRGRLVQNLTPFIENIQGTSVFRVNPPLKRTGVYFISLNSTRGVFFSKVVM